MRFFPDRVLAAALFAVLAGCGGGAAGKGGAGDGALQFSSINEQGFAEYHRVRDGMIVVHVPAGSYLRRPYDVSFTLPGEEVEVPGFLIDKHEVTNGQLARFLRESGTGGEAEVDGKRRPVVQETPWGLRRTVAGWIPQEGYADHPAVGVTGWGALLYARWVGEDLPVPDQWMKAAGGKEGRELPFAPRKGRDLPCSWYGAGYFRTLPVGSFAEGVSPVGCHDMAGNVYDRVRAPQRDGFPVMLKGGAWVTTHPLNLRVADLCMQSMDAAEMSVGFRCAVWEKDVRLPPVPASPARGSAFVPAERPPEPDEEGGLPPPSLLLLATSLREGIEEARERRCPVLVTLHYDTCGQCDRLHAEVLSDPAFIRFAREHCVVVVGQDPHDALDEPHPPDDEGRCTLWPTLRCEEHERIFFEALEAVGSFTVSPGCCILDPRPGAKAAPAERILVGEDALPKNGTGLEAYLEGIRKAQAAIGPGLSRGEWIAIRKALAALDAGKPGAKEKLQGLLEGKDERIPLVAEARRLLAGR